MNIASVDMKKEFEDYNRIAPRQKVSLLGSDFVYRYYRNPDPSVNATIVMLAGGTGLGDGFFAFAKDFMKKYSLINFNYPMGYKNNEQLSDAIAALIEHIGAENVYFGGQSYGGALAQIIAKRHPEVVKGLILTATASMSNHIRFEGMQCLVNMFNEEKEEKNIRTYKKLPMSLLPGILNLAFKKYLKDDPGAQKAVKELLNQVKPDLTKEYFCHMTHLLCDLRNYLGTCDEQDYAYLKGRVLIIEPDDDKTFTTDIKDELIRIMPEPTVYRDIEGGHLAMLMDTDTCVRMVDDFMEKQKL